MAIRKSDSLLIYRQALAQKAGIYGGTGGSPTACGLIDTLA